MGWAYGIAHDGREIGYGVEATCDQPGCDAKIDRGIGYLCGDHAGLAVVLDGADGPGCGRYYCGQHNYFLSEDGSCDHRVRAARRGRAADVPPTASAPGTHPAT
jgi:hypothetical protein